MDAYQLRAVELQARYRLVASRAPITWSCDGNPANQVVVTHFATESPSLIAERGDQTLFMQLQPAASGSRYTGRNESLWEHQGLPGTRAALHFAQTRIASPTQAIKKGRCHQRPLA